MIPKKLYYFCVRTVLLLLDIVTSILLRWWYGKRKKLPPITNPLLLESATGLAAKIRKKQVRSVDVVQAYISRIKEVNPFIHAVVDERFQEALDEARQADERVRKVSAEELAEKEPFLGVPITTKEAIGVKGLKFTCGLVRRKGIRATKDAATIALMRKAGAIPLAVTNIPELVMWFESSNNVYGRTKNPYHTSRVPGGSTGGEGALLASAGSVIGIGNDIAGSIRVPSFCNGIFGHKTSTAIVPNDGGYPPSEGEIDSFISTGPMCRYAADLLPMLKIMAAPNIHKLKLDTPVDVRNLKVYYMEDDGGNYMCSPVETDIKKAFKRVLVRLQGNYGIRPQRLELKELSSAFMIWACKVINAGEPKQFAKLVAGHENKLFLPLELIKCLSSCSEHTIHVIFLALLECIGPAKDTKICREYVEMCATLKDKLSTTLGNDGIFLYPTQPVSAQYFNQTIYRCANYGYTGVFSVMGFPSTHCPLGLNKKGLPIGIQIIGGINNDHLTIALATALENEFGGWVNPSPVV